MQTKFFAAVVLFAAFGAAQDVDLDDFPRVCREACRDIARVSNDCDNQTNSDSAERDCVCNSDNVQQQANSCAACVKANPLQDDDDDDDLRAIFRACNWNYDDVASTSSSASVTSSTDSATTTESTTTTDTVPASTTTRTSDGTTSTETIPATTVTSTGPASTTDTETSSSDGAGAAITAGVGIIAAGFMAALPVVL